MDFMLRIGESIWQSFGLRWWQVKELRARLGPLTGRSLQYATDSCLKRYLNARNWNIKKAEKMIRESLKWRATYKPEEICWVSLFVSVAGHLHISISYGYMLPPFFTSTHSYTVNISMWWSTCCSFLCRKMLPQKQRLARFIEQIFMTSRVTQ